MLKVRNEQFEPGQGYQVDEMIQSIEELSDLSLFHAAILSPEEFDNPLRDILAHQYTKRPCPSLRIMMSMLIRNPDSAYTAIFFAQRKATQVANNLIALFFTVITLLKAAKFKITEIIFVTPVHMSYERESERKNIAREFFIQVFSDEEILAPATECYLAPKMTVFTPEQTAKFLAREKLDVKRIQQISHTDPLLKYIGARPRRIVKILRPPIVPISIVKSEMTYAWIM
jgi:DNA-directed RNA polymerase subunit H (RpoH/RPB5)